MLDPGRIGVPTASRNRVRSCNVAKFFHRVVLDPFCIIGALPFTSSANVGMGYLAKISYQCRVSVSFVDFLPTRIRLEYLEYLIPVKIERKHKTGPVLNVCFKHLSRV